MHYLARLVKHLHLLLRVAIVLEHVNLRYHVVCQLISELVYCRLLIVGQLLILLLQLCHSCCSGARCRLIGGNVDSVDMRQLL